MTLATGVELPAATLNGRIAALPPAVRKAARLGCGSTFIIE